MRPALAPSSRLKGLGRLHPDAARTDLRVALVALGAAAIWFLADKLGPQGFPIGVAIRGAVIGSLYALGAMGLILVFRANRVVNFAQAELGAVAAVLVIELVVKLHVNYFLALGTGLVAAVLTGAIVDLVIIRAFRKAPRLILTVATIGVAQILNGLSIQMPLWFSGGIGAVVQQGQTPFHTPFNAHFNIGVVRFFGDHIFAMILVPLVIVALSAFLRYTDYGVAIRASAENSDRANLLGMPVGRLSTVVWGIAGFLSAMGVILRVQIVGFSSFSGVSGGGPSLLLRTLAAAVIARMESMPVAAGAAVGIGVFETFANWTWGNGTYADALLVGVILIALIVQRGHFKRAEETGISSWRALREVRAIPTELRRVPEVRLGFAGLWVLLGAVVLTFPLWARPDRESLAAVVFVYAMVAVSLVVLTGWVGQISLGQWALVGFGGATVSVLVGRHGVDLFVALLTGMAVSALVALIIGIPALRISGPFLAVTTLAFSVTAASFFFVGHYFPWFIEQNVQRPMLWKRFPITADWQFYYFCLACLILVILAARNLRRSRTGRAMVAIRDNEPAAQSTSLNVPLLKLTAFAISGAITGLAGGLYVLHQNGFYTDSYGPEVSILLFTMVVIGGLGSIPGAILGAVYVSGVQFFVGGGWALLASGTGILLILLFLPGGLGAGMYRIRDELLRWIANRRGIIVPSLLADIRQEELATEQTVPLEDVLAGVRSHGDGNGARALTRAEARR